MKALLFNHRKWHAKRGQFIAKQHMRTHGAHDWEFFSANKDSFLIIANTAEPISDETSRGHRNHYFDSKIWRWDKDNLMFGKE